MVWSYFIQFLVSIVKDYPGLPTNYWSKLGGVSDFTLEIWPKGGWETPIMCRTPYCEGVLSEEVVWSDYIEILVGIVADYLSLLTRY